MSICLFIKKILELLIKGKEKIKTYHNYLFINDDFLMFFEFLKICMYIERFYEYESWDNASIIYMVPKKGENLFTFILHHIKAIFVFLVNMGVHLYSLFQCFWIVIKKIKQKQEQSQVGSRDSFKLLSTKHDTV